MMSETLPEFEHFPNPMQNGCIVEKQTYCRCCNQSRAFMYVGPIYSTDEIDEVCPWCIADGKAASKWSASFNDVYLASSEVPSGVIETISQRTPGYETWQGNKWLFSESDALIFVGEVDGNELLNGNDVAKIGACRDALSEWNFPKEFDLSNLVIGGQPAIYLFRDKVSGNFKAYADMT